MGEATPLQIKQIAREIFELFKKRTDGANIGVDVIHIGSIRGFHYDNKLPIEVLEEAAQLLCHRNLLVPASNSMVGVYRLTSLGKTIEPDDVFERIVDRAFVHQLSELIDQELVRGCLDKSYEDAITSAFRILEERIRKRINAGPELFGLDLVEQAFHPDAGRLAFGETDAERSALFHIFRSAFLMLRNPPSHRYLKEFAGAEIVEIVLFVDFLLKIVGKATSRT